MFILLLTYIKPIEAVEQALEAHVAYLEKYYALNKFICSGRRVPRTGGVILCTAENLDEVSQIYKEDPFYTQEIANYEIIEFTPTKYAEAFKSFI